MFTRVTLSALLAATAMAAGADYSKKGANWGDKVPLCKEGKEQSPIDLFTDKASYSGDMEINGYGYKDFSAPKDKVVITTEKV